VTRGYSIIQPRVSTSLPSATSTGFSRLFSDPTGVDPYSMAVSDVYQDLSGESIYHGKGIYDVAALHLLLAGRFPCRHLLSHDLIEGAHVRTAFASDIELFDLFPKDYQTYSRRQHRWIRGDWQIADWLLPIVPKGNTARAANPLSVMNKWKIADNLRRSLWPVSTVLLLLEGWMVSSRPLFWDVAAGLSVVCPTVILLIGQLTSPQGIRQLSGREPRATIYRTLFIIALLPHMAYLSVDAIARVCYRRLVSRRRMLEWETALESNMKANGRTSGFILQLCWVPVASIAFMIATTACHGLLVAAQLPFIALWCSSPVVIWWIGRNAPSAKNRALGPSDQALIRQYARRTWRYFDCFVNESTNWLPPDNYQETLNTELAQRTSPTNIGLWLLSAVSAADLGYLPLKETFNRIEASVDALSKMERYNGHFLNWYNTATMHPLFPRYVSMVDSGNLLGSFWATGQALSDFGSRSVVDTSALQGLVDTLEILRAELPSGDYEGRDPGFDACVAGITRATTIDTENVQMFVRAFRAARQFVPSLRAACGRWESNALASSRYWAEQVANHIDVWNDEIDRLLPWVDVLSQVPAGGLLPISRDAHEWRRDALSENPSLAAIDQNHMKGLPALLLARARLNGRLGVENVVEWLDKLEQAYTCSQKNAREALQQVNRVVKQTEDLANDCDMRFLYDAGRRLFHVGYNVEDHRMDQFYYDLLASEARVGSLCAIASGQVPASHWFALGRPMGDVGGRDVLLSWSGTMFEYLMPPLLTKLFEKTLLASSCDSAVAIQIAYGRKRGAPWGISESGHSTIDSRLVYQYHAFGVPGLGIRRNTDDPLVVAPYATLLALGINPVAAVQNLKRMASTRTPGLSSMLGAYGFYEAIDYSRQRDQQGERGVIVHSYMAHHQGMSLVAIDNAINGNVMQERFHSDPRVKSVESLLHERIPFVPVIERNDVEAQVPFSEDRPISKIQPVSMASDTASTEIPRVHLLSNGKYSLMVTNSGGGYSRWGDFDISRWRSDITADSYGAHCFVKDIDSGDTWCTTYQPLGATREPDRYHVLFTTEKAEFRRRDYGIEIITEMVVSPEDDVEIRRLSIINHSDRTRRLELTSYVELALNGHAADRTHPAFSKLFVQTEANTDFGSLIAHRRPQEGGETPYAVHVLATESGVVQLKQFETAREKFIGRGRSLKDPIALTQPLSNSSGAVLDPIFSLRREITVRPGRRVQLAFSTAAAANQNDAISLSSKYSDIETVNRALELAWAHGQLDLRHLKIQPSEAMRYQLLAASVLYPNSGLRPPDERLRQNRLGQEQLWAIGISGDLPIVTVAIGAQEDIDVVLQVIKAHAYWRLHGLVCDLVIVNQEPYSYEQLLLRRLERLVSSYAHFTDLEKPGGIFLRNSRQLSADDVTLLLSVSRIALVAARGGLSQQVAMGSRKIVRHLALRDVQEHPSDFMSAQLSFEELAFHNGYGGFTANGNEYVIYLGNGQSTPSPWVNVMANPKFGAIVSESGAGTCWYQNSQTNRLTPWSNDPVADPASEAVYIRDDDTGYHWTVTSNPIRENEAYRARHGQGYSIFEHDSHGIKQSLATFVPVDDSGGVPVKIQILRLKNETSAWRSLTVTPYAEWVLGPSREETQMFVVTSFDPTTHVLSATNRYNGLQGANVAFLSMSEPVHTYTGDRSEFIGRNGTLGSPDALRRVGLSNRVGAALDPCGALQTTVALRPDEERVIVVVVGEAESEAEATSLAQRFTAVDEATAALASTRSWWDELLGAVQVATPDSANDMLLNRWLLYQTLSARIWGRTGFYQSSGAYGFRDQLQDVLGLLLTNPGIAREHIVRAASRQFVDGDVQHWWHPQTGAGVRTRISDDLLWLPYVVAEYVRVTGDDTLLDQQAPYLEGAPLTPDEHDRYFTPEISETEDTILDHCRRAVERGLTEGPHGLPLMGGGDWNDGLNRVGAGGHGESVWLAWFLVHVLCDFAEMLRLRDDLAGSEEQLARARDLTNRVEMTSWDGNWYRRAYYDDGAPLGSSECDEMVIDSLPQSWSVICGLGNLDRSKVAMHSVVQRLVRDDVGVLLFTPPFDKTDHDPGYVKAYIPGLRENGGQYTHGSLWTAQAYARLGDGDTAVRLLRLMGPRSHSETQEQAEKYKVEPYVAVGDIYSAVGQEGRGGWTWYTGAASWMYRIWVNDVLGLKKRGTRFTIDPAIPKDWPSYQITVKYKSAVYKIIVENPDGVGAGTRSFELDSCKVDGEWINMVGDGKTHNVRVVLSAGPRTQVFGDAGFENPPIAEHVQAARD